jgi:hypothetical protein
VEAVVKLLAIIVLLLCISSVPAVGQVLWDNGPINGTTDGWTINFGFAVSNSFTSPGDSPVTGLNFGAWLFPGDVLQSAEVLIGTSEFDGSLFDGVVLFTQSNCSGNQYGFNVCSESSAFLGPDLAPGTYWLTLENATVNTGDPVYWDENSGPSSASENSVGTIPSEAFTLSSADVTTTTTSSGTVPEPDSLLLLGSGILGVLAFCGRRLF